MKSVSLYASIALALVLTACPDTGGVKPPVVAEVKEIYVKSDTGLDTNPGTLEKPLKTIKKALSGVKTGQSIVMYAGTYDAASGETFNYDIPDQVTLKANSGSVILQGSTGRALMFLGAGSLQYVTLKGFPDGLSSKTGATGAIGLVGVRFEAPPPPSGFLGGNGVTHLGNAEMLIKDCVFEGPYRSAISAAGNPDGSSRPKLTVQGGNITGVSQESIRAYYADLSISDVIEKNARFGLYLSDGTTAVVTGVKFGPNSDDAIATRGKGNKLKVRSSQFLNNQTSIFADDDFLEIDLGQSDTVDAGRNVFKSNLYNGIWTDNSDLTGPRTIYAAGNEWEANTQGSDANGRYKNTDPLVCTSSSPASGKNYRIDAKAGQPELCLKR
jgi:hypothetical protein